MDPTGNKRISLDALSKSGQPGAPVAPPKAPPKSSMVKNYEPAPEAGPGAGAPKRDAMAAIKLGVAVVCLGVAGVLLAHNFGLITLWGGEAPPPPPTEEEVQFVETGKKYQQQREQQWEATPEAKRVPKAGS